MDRFATSALVPAVVRVAAAASRSRVEQAAGSLGWRVASAEGFTPADATAIDAMEGASGGLVIAAVASADDHPPRPAMELGAEASASDVARAMVEAARWKARRAEVGQRRKWVERIIGGLSKREQLILRMVFDECPNTQIASVCAVSVRTIESARGKVFRELGVATVVGLARLLAETGVYDDAPADYLPPVDSFRNIAGTSGAANVTG
ncbi:MAG: LuxR C-terminal-related transcriptional regulator [Lacipirellulaceae bacterium]